MQTSNPPLDDGLAAARALFAAAGATLANERRDFPEWHLGRPHYALWAVDLDEPPVRSRVAAAADQLAGLLLADYVRQPHITLALCGFPCATPLHPDDYGPAMFERQLAALQALAPEPFGIELGPLASFSSAPFLAVQDVEGGIGRLHRALAGRSGMGHDTAPYLAHVTVGLYADAWPITTVLPQLEAHAASTSGVRPYRIHSISLMRYAATEIGGRLDTLAEFSLIDRRLSWHAAPFAQDLAHASAP